MRILTIIFVVAWGFASGLIVAGEPTGEKIKPEADKLNNSTKTKEQSQAKPTVNLQDDKRKNGWAKSKPTTGKIKPKSRNQKKPSVFKIRSWIKKLDSKKKKERELALDLLLANKPLAAKEISYYIKTYPRARRLACIDLLRRIRGPDARKSLASRAIFDKDRQVRKDAASAIKAMGGRVAMSYILKKAVSGSIKTRKKVARAITNIGDKHYLDYLIPATRHAAAYADVRMDLRARHRSLGNMGVSNIQGNTTRLTIDLPTTNTAKVETEFWTLGMVAGKDFGTDWKAWKRWWQASRGEFIFPDLDEK